MGYKEHLTETCDPDQPDLITQIITTPATTPDCVMGPTIVHDLAARDLLPGTHLLDSGYVDVELLVTAQRQYHIDVVGPAFGSYSRQHQTGQGYDLQAFVLDWEARQAHCPQGHASIHWRPGHDVSGDPVIRIRFDGATCRSCPTRQACASAKAAPRQPPSGRKPIMKRSRRRASARRRQHSKPSMPSGRGWRAASRKGSGALICAGVGTLG